MSEMLRGFVWEKVAGWQGIFFLLYSFLVFTKCQVLNLRVGRSHDQVLQRAHCRMCIKAWIKRKNELNKIPLQQELVKTFIEFKVVQTSKVHLQCLYSPLSEYRCSAKVWSNTNVKHANEKKKTKLVSGPIFRVVHQSIVKHRHLGNFNFYKVLYSERASLAHSVCLPYKTL